MSGQIQAEEGAGAAHCRVVILAFTAGVRLAHDT
jgi:hypothetical protein